MSTPGPIPITGLRLYDWLTLDQVPSSWHMLEILEPHGLKKHLPADTLLGIFKTNFSLRLSFPSVSLYLCVYKMTTMSLLNEMTSADR